MPNVSAQLKQQLVRRKMQAAAPTNSPARPVAKPTAAGGEEKNPLLAVLLKRALAGTRR